MPRIFISYRRDDSNAISERIYKSLSAEFGKDAVFRDRDTIPKGSDFRKEIEQHLFESEIVLVIIGPSWLDIQGKDGIRRLNAPADYVRFEIEMALRHNKIIIPLLINGASMPPEEKLPPSINQLSYKNAASLSEVTFYRDIKRLIYEIQKSNPVRKTSSRLLRIVFVGLVLMATVATTLPLVSSWMGNANIGSLIKTPFRQFVTQPPTVLTVIPTGDPLTPVLHNTDWTFQEHEFENVPMMLVPAGCFKMGSEDGAADERPVKQVCFNMPFWIDKTEITNAQFARFEGQADNSNQWKGGNRPRESITWLEARDFCNKRGARLPTEAEWEYAARGPDHLTYPWGNNFAPDNVVYGNNSANQTADVGSRPAGASWVGALDMSGNVKEWVSSLYVDYPYDESHENSSDAISTRVLRGGSWDNVKPDDLRAADRLWDALDFKYSGIGFRCARDFE